MLYHAADCAARESGADAGGGSDDGLFVATSTTFGGGGVGGDGGEGGVRKVGATEIIEWGTRQGILSKEQRRLLIVRV